MKQLTVPLLRVIRFANIADVLHMPEAVQFSTARWR